MKAPEEKAKVKFEEVLTAEEVKTKEAAKKIRDLKEEMKQADPNDFKTAMKMAQNLSEVQDAKKKFAKAARDKKGGNQGESQLDSVPKKQNQG